MAKIALGTWAWGAGAFGGDAVFGSKTDVENLKPVFEAAMKAGLNLWDTATVYGMGESEKILGSFVKGQKREDVEVSTKFTPQVQSSLHSRVEYGLQVLYVGLAAEYCVSSKCSCAPSPGS